MMKTIIFTDLDGTLLDSRYSFAPAAQALKRIKAEGIPLVLATSKSRPETELIREMLSNADPFITENGGGIYIPASYFPFPIKGEEKNGYRVITLGAGYEDLRRALAGIREKSGRDLSGFGDMTDEEVAGLTGLTPAEAALAKMREFDEPFIMRDGNREDARRLVEESGYSFTAGRFFHITGQNDKGRAVEILTTFYRSVYGKIATVGVGNSENDIPLLRKVDYPVLVMNEDGRYEEVNGVPGLIKAHGIGPEGWDRAIPGVLDTIKASEGYKC